MAKAKQRMIEAAIALFAEKGVAGTTTRDITDKADTALGNLYRHFESKDEMAQEIYRDAIERLSHGLLTSAEDKLGSGPRISAMTRWFCSAYDAEPALIRFLLLNQDETIRSIDLAKANPLEILKAEVAFGQVAGEILPGNAAIRAAGILGAVLQPATQLSRHDKAWKRMTKLTPLADEIVAMALRAAGVVEKQSA
jgi:AcrR family transcriptional regulator